MVQEHFVERGWCARCLVRGPSCALPASHGLCNSSLRSELISRVGEAGGVIGWHPLLPSPSRVRRRSGKTTAPPDPFVTRWLTNFQETRALTKQKAPGFTRTPFLQCRTSSAWPSPAEPSAQRHCVQLFWSHCTRAIARPPPRVRFVRRACTSDGFVVSTPRSICVRQAPLPLPASQAAPEAVPQ